MAISAFFKKKEKQTSNKPANYSSVLDEVYTRVQNLRIGMYVCKLDRPWTETSFKFQGFLIETEQELRALRDACEHVFIDVTKQKKHLDDVRPNKIRKNTDKKKLRISEPVEKLGSFEQEFSRAEKTYQDSKVFVSDLMDKWQMGRESIPLLQKMLLLPVLIVYSTLQMPFYGSAS